MLEFGKIVIPLLFIEPLPSIDAIHDLAIQRFYSLKRRHRRKRDPLVSIALS